MVIFDPSDLIRKALCDAPKRNVINHLWSRFDDLRRGFWVRMILSNPQQSFA